MLLRISYSRKMLLCFLLIRQRTVGCFVNGHVCYCERWTCCSCKTHRDVAEDQESGLTKPGDAGQFGLIW
jgi:hypothetical protein